MVDSISDEDADRWDEVVPPELTTKQQISGWFEDREPTNPDGSTWKQSQVSGFAERVSERRDERFAGDPEIRETVNKKSDLSGGGVTGVRTTMVRDEKGQYITSSKNLNTYVDSSGNLIGYPEGRGNEPGARRVIERGVE